MARVALLLTDGFADWEYAPLAGAGRGYYDLEIGCFAPEAGSVRSMGGLTAQAELSFDQLTTWRPDAAVAIGGTIWETDKAPDPAEALRTLHAGGAIVAGICGGTLALARAGLLDAVRHTSNDPGFLTENAERYAGQARYVVSAAAVADNRTITAPGTAPVTFAAAIFDALDVAPEAVAAFRAMMAAEHG